MMSPRRPMRRAMPDNAASERDAQHRAFAELDVFRQRIARDQKVCDADCKRINRRDFETQPEIRDLPRQGLALHQQTLVARREFGETLAQLRRGFRRAERFDAKSISSERVERHIDAVEIAIVRDAILQMIVDLQRGADRVRRGPGRAALAVHVEHIASDRHRRISAIVDQIVPIRIAMLAGVQFERPEQIERVLRRQAALRQHVAQRRRLPGCALPLPRRSPSSPSSRSIFSCSFSVA